MKLYIIRHGQTAWNKEKRFQGQRDIMLNEDGIKGAEKVAKGMKNVPIDIVISSPLMRAIQTAGIVTERRLPIQTDKRISEMSFGAWEGESVVNSNKIPKEFKKQFYDDPYNCIKPPKGESFKDVLKRTELFYQSLLDNDKYKDANILISTHGAASRCLLANFYDDKEDIWRGCVPPNCSLSVVEIKDGKTTILEKDKIFN